MTSPAPRTWFVTGASRGLGADIVRAVLAAGDRVVATARNRQTLVETLGPDADNLLSLALDVTRPDQVQAAVDAAQARFGRIDVLVNNAGYGHLSVFEESTAQDAQAQYDTNVFGLMHVTRAVLPIMRAQRSGRIFNIASVGGIVGGESGTLYCASKFAVEGFSESLAGEVRRFGVHVTVVEPGFFRTDFLEATSVRHGSHPIADYAQVAADLKAFYDARSRNQAGDPARLGQALVTLANAERPPVRWCAGTDALAMVQAKIDSLQGELDAWRDLSASTDGDFEFRPEAETTTAWR
ncbi:SDR family NAD(P)-dependent oxidoreductase [Caulobacter sp. 602-2]|uniref:SDR family NAD(P)-dependent oxidoreductase n=1 Tax=Caulobacter sp. 602-2 TaxID=2710887 RepID=A0A6G4QVT1_9CAUL|nr:oxidoreductase [Caulobacter sp. 602-2]NGM49651.1 SDR family NAD(P)-dependent oxidoreductase [Caulobacter sp. 602-2]